MAEVIGVSAEEAMMENNGEPESANPSLNGCIDQGATQNSSDVSASKRKFSDMTFGDEDYPPMRQTQFTSSSTVMIDTECFSLSGDDSNGPLISGTQQIQEQRQIQISSSSADFSQFRPENKPLLLRAGASDVFSLGSIVSDRPKFHSMNMIYPVGFCTERVFLSYKNPGTNCIYTCKILDGSEGPQFCVLAQDDSEVICASTATLAWGEVRRRVSNAIPQIELSKNISGLVFFGLVHPTVSRLIRMLPGAKDCAHFAFRLSDEAASLLDDECDSIDDTDIDPAADSAPFPPSEFHLNTEDELSVEQYESELLSVKERGEAAVRELMETIASLGVVSVPILGGVTSWSLQECQRLFEGIPKYAFDFEQHAIAIGTKHAGEVEQFVQAVVDALCKKGGALTCPQQSANVVESMETDKRERGIPSPGQSEQILSTECDNPLPESELPTFLRPDLKTDPLGTARILWFWWIEKVGISDLTGSAVQVCHEARSESDKMSEILLAKLAEVRTQTRYSQSFVSKLQSHKRRSEDETKKAKSETEFLRKKLSESEKGRRKAEHELKKARQLVEGGQSERDRALYDGDNLRYKIECMEEELRQESKAKRAVVSVKDRLQAEVTRLKKIIDVDQISLRTLEDQKKHLTRGLEVLHVQVAQSEARQAVAQSKIAQMHVQSRGENSASVSPGYYAAAAQSQSSSYRQSSQYQSSSSSSSSQFQHASSSNTQFSNRNHHPL